LPITQFIYNATPQEGIDILPFKANYGYKLKTLLSPKQAKKSSEIAKERVKTFINLYKNL
jgi:pyruvate-formate lyase-activating enzyme